MRGRAAKRGVPQRGASSSDVPPNAQMLGMRIKRARLKAEWTLAEAAERCGVARSTLSKIENDLMSPTYDILYRIVVGLKLDLEELFDPRTTGTAVGRRSITRKLNGKVHETDYYVHELVATDLAHKKMLPFKTRIKARSIDEFEDLIRHEGEEFFVVVSGTVKFFADHYVPEVLSVGDSVYFDSRLGHAIVSVGPEDAEVMWVCTGLPDAGTSEISN